MFPVFGKAGLVTNASLIPSLLILVSIIAIEEISYIYSIQNNLFIIIRENNSQNEINFHNSFLFQPHLNKGFIFLNLFLFI